MVLRFFLLAAAFLFIYCSVPERDNPDDPRSSKYREIGDLSSEALSSSSVTTNSSSAVSSSNSTVLSSSSLRFSSSTVPSSSSAILSSSSVGFAGCTANDNTSTHYYSDGIMKEYGFVTYEGQTYKTVKIGTQTWMAENFNYNATGSTYGTYGRLYNWATAMALQYSCNSNKCASQIGTKHRGICPNDWHIPSDAELTTLTNFVGTNGGTKLKATSCWGSYNGEDKYGFAALPEVEGFPNGAFSDGNHAVKWWGSTESSAPGAAYMLSVSYSNENVIVSTYNKTQLISVRCLQD